MSLEKQYKSIYHFNESKTSEFDIEKNATSVYVEKTNSTKHHQHTEHGHISGTPCLFYRLPASGSLRLPHYPGCGRQDKVG